MHYLKMDLAVKKWIHHPCSNFNKCIKVPVDISLQKIDIRQLQGKKKSSNFLHQRLEKNCLPDAPLYPGITSTPWNSVIFEILSLLFYKMYSVSLCHFSMLSYTLLILCVVISLCMFNRCLQHQRQIADSLY